MCAKMQFLENSLIELIIQTSTNLPPDVREAMGYCLQSKRPERKTRRRSS